jgi:anti-sigma-K factor RskA
MPRGTRAVVVTLEPAGGSPQPSGPQVLAGDQMQELL